jgi:hypothetical protein
MTLLNCPAFNQGDSKWKDKLMLPGSLTLGKAGCLVTCIASVLHQFGYIDEDPGTVCDKLVKAGGFMKSSDLILSKVSEIWGKTSFIASEDTTANIHADANPVQVTTAIERIKKLVSRGIPVIVNVDHVYHDGVADHFVVIANRDLMTMNPDGGYFHDFENKYGDARIGVKGYRVFAGAPMAFLDGTTKDQEDIGVTIGKLAVASKQVSNLMVKESLEGLTR